jgi:hypothetical protein
LLAWPKVSKKNSALTLGKGRSNMMLIILVKMGERDLKVSFHVTHPPTIFCKIVVEWSFHFNSDNPLNNYFMAVLHPNFFFLEHGCEKANPNHSPKVTGKTQLAWWCGETKLERHVNLFSLIFLINSLVGGFGWSGWFEKFWYELVFFCETRMWRCKILERKHFFSRA